MSKNHGGYITLVFKDNIESVEIDPTKEAIDKIRDNLENLFDKCQVKMARSGQDLIESRNQLVKWLEQNRLPVKLEKSSQSEQEAEEEEKLIINIFDLVYIHPPYEIENCMSTNEIVLNRIKHIMNKRLI